MVLQVRTDAVTTRCAFRATHNDSLAPFANQRNVCDIAPPRDATGATPSVLSSDEAGFVAVLLEGCRTPLLNHPPVTPSGDVVPPWARYAAVVREDAWATEVRINRKRGAQECKTERSFW